MENFIFTSTDTECQITGIKDKTVTDIVVPDYVTDISQGAFSGCGLLERITIPFVGGSKTAKSAGKSTLFGYIFGTSKYDGATSKKQHYSAYSTSYVYYYIPTSLRHVTITSGVILYGAFYNCDNLTGVTFGKDVTSIGNRAFYACNGVTGITITDNVTNIGEEAFDSCYSLKSLIIPDNSVNIGFNAFSGCPIETITLPTTAISAFNGASFKTVIINGGTSIGNYAFANFQNLTSVFIPDSVTSIGIQAFVNCKSLVNITIPDSVETIGEKAFSGCKSLTSVVIGNGVTSIGKLAFYNCSALNSVIFKVTEGWYSTIDTDTSGTSVSSTELVDPSTAAEYLTHTYCDYYWKRG